MSRGVIADVFSSYRRLLFEVIFAWPKNQEHFSVIEDYFSVIKENFSGIGADFSVIVENFSGIVEYFSVIVESFSGILDYFSVIVENFSGIIEYFSVIIENIFVWVSSIDTFFSFFKISKFYPWLLDSFFLTVDKSFNLPYINNYVEVTVLNKYEIEIPNQVVCALGLMDKDVVNMIKKELAVHLFQREMLSFGQARQLSALSVWDFMEALRERRIPLHYSEKEYEEDSKVIEELL